MYTPLLRNEETGSTPVVPTLTDIVGIWRWQWPDKHHLIECTWVPIKVP